MSVARVRLVLVSVMLITFALIAVACEQSPSGSSSGDGVGSGTAASDSGAAGEIRVAAERQALDGRSEGSSTEDSAESTSPEMFEFEALSYERARVGAFIMPGTVSVPVASVDAGIETNVALAPAASAD